MDVYIENAHKDYGGRRIIDIDILNFKKGHIYAILGLNGSGKTTLLECIGGINTLSGGKILYNGLYIDYVRKDIGIMTQKPYLFNDSVINNIKLGLKFRRLSFKEENKRMGKYLHYFDIDNLLYKNAKKLSGGEGAKTALLRTAVLEANLMLLDEPTASMDMESTLRAEKLILDMKNEGRTIIIITHDLYQAQRISDYVVFMDKGKVIEMGKKDEVLKNPQNRLVKLILNI